MAFKFLNIGKANARIAELETQVESLTKERDAAIAASGENEAEIEAEQSKLVKAAADSSAQVTQLSADLATARASIASQSKEIEGLNAKLTAKDAEVKIQVARQVAETQSQIGLPGKPEAPKAGTRTATTQTRTGMQRVLAAAKQDLEAAGYERKSN